MDEAERGLDEDVGVVEVLGERGGFEQRVAVVGIAGLALGGAELGEDFGALVLVGWGLLGR